MRPSDLRAVGLVAVLAVAGTAGCLDDDSPSPSFPAVTACDPTPGDDPFPADEVIVYRNVSRKGEILRIAGCIANGEDRARGDGGGDCGPRRPVEVNVSHVADGEPALLRPYADVAYTQVCKGWTIPANTAWAEGSFEIRWDLRKDVCQDDEACEVDGEGERVPGGRYRVTIDGLFARPQTWTVTLAGE